MAKKRRNKNKISVTRQRANLRFRKRRETLLPSSSFQKPYKPPTATKKSPILHDRRLYKPNRLKRLLLYGSQDKISRTTLRSKTKSGKPYRVTPRQGFINPKRQEVCKRRARRRSVLFMLNRVGRGKGIKTKKHFNEYSKIRC